MTKKTAEKSTELELSFSDEMDCWIIRSTGGSEIPASNFEVLLWQEIVSLRVQVAYLMDRNNHLKEMVSILNKECDEK